MMYGSFVELIFILLTCVQFASLHKWFCRVKIYISAWLIVRMSAVNKEYRIGSRTFPWKHASANFFLFLHKNTSLLSKLFDKNGSNFLAILYARLCQILFQHLKKRRCKTICFSWTWLCSLLCGFALFYYGFSETGTDGLELGVWRILLSLVCWVLRFYLFHSIPYKFIYVWFVLTHKYIEYNLLLWRWLEKEGFAYRKIPD